MKFNKGKKSKTLGKIFGVIIFALVLNVNVSSESPSKNNNTSGFNVFGYNVQLVETTYALPPQPRTGLIWCISSIVAPHYSCMPECSTYQCGLGLASCQ